MEYEISEKLNPEERAYINGLIVRGQANETGKGSGVTHKLIIEDGKVVDVKRVRFSTS